MAFCIILRFVPSDFYLFEPLAAMTKVSIYLNYALGIFNLIPLPPLDGSKILESFLSYNATQKLEKLTQYSFIILLVLLFTGALRILIYPINFLATVTIYTMASLLGVTGIF